MENVNVNDRVLVETTNDGSFTGVVTHVNSAMCFILPDEEAIATFLGGDGTYDLGRAHWDAKLTKL